MNRLTRFLLFLAASYLAVALSIPLSPGESPGIPPNDQQFAMVIEWSPGDAGSSAPSSFSLPPNGCLWWLYWPGPPPVALVQTDYLDNGDNMVSVGDSVGLEDVYYPIIALELSYWTEKYYSHYDDEGDVVNDPRGSHVIIPPDGFDPTDPPAFPMGCPESGVNGWTEYNLSETHPNFYWGGFGCEFWMDDNENQILDPRDRIAYNLVGPGGLIWQIELATLTVTVGDLDAVPLEPRTWGRLKRMYRQP